jgi:capsule biosynthesis phosphatase|tara:strand:- start:8110 stop:8490 length:381 start_codon:yes stop_codon:yes gene_type:complete
MDLVKKQNRESVVIDIDHTISFPRLDLISSAERFGLSTPNHDVINGMRRLKEKGFKIILLTARRMLTHDGDVEAIIADVGDITINWLKEHDVPYDEIIWGKPYSSTWYVDDKSMNLEEFKEWTDSI